MFSAYQIENCNIIFNLPRLGMLWAAALQVDRPSPRGPRAMIAAMEKSVARVFTMGTTSIAAPCPSCCIVPSNMTITLQLTPSRVPHDNTRTQTKLHSELLATAARWQARRSREAWSQLNGGEGWKAMGRGFTPRVLLVMTERRGKLL